MMQLKSTTRDILKIFKKHYFTKLTLKQLSEELGNLEESAIDQRLRRDPGVFEWSGKPKEIWVIPKIPEVVFFRSNNFCVRCRNHFPNEELNVTHISLNVEDIDHYTNLAPVCNSCLKIVNQASELLTKGVKPKSSSEKQRYSGIRWQYKRVTIREEVIKKPGALESTNYYSFHEDSEDPDTWQHLEGESLDDILSTTIEDIMNYFGEDGWECIKYIIPYSPDDDEEFPLPEEFGEETTLIFKRAI